ncbi:MAG: hypothetical protein ACRYGF_05795 [Janthinobacterium lividum]
MKRQMLLLATGTTFLVALPMLSQTAATTGKPTSPAAPVLVLAPAPTLAALATNKPVFTVYLRERSNVTQWFSALPDPETYAHGDSLLRISLAQ